MMAAQAVSRNEDLQLMMAYLYDRSSVPGRCSVVVSVQLVGSLYVSSCQDLHAIIGAIFITTGVTYMCTLAGQTKA